MNKKWTIAFVCTNLVLIGLFLMSSTGVLISNSAGSAHSSAALEIRSTTQGLLPPVLTTTQRDNISSPATGLTIYNSTSNAIESYNGSNWQVTGTTNSPAGTIMAYGGSSIPSGWLECNGDDVSRSTYSALYSAIGDAWGEGDGSSTFHLPDLRGRFLRGHNNSSGNDPNASSRTASNTGGNTQDNVGTIQGYATALPSSNFTTNTTGSHSHADPLRYDPSNYSFANGYSSLTNGNREGDGINTAESADKNPYTSSAGSHSHSITSGGDDETRPVNAAVKFIIKY